MVGTTFRRAGAQGLAYYTLPAQAVGARQALHGFCGVAESVYLATCNRVEFFFAVRPGTTVAQVRKRFFAYFQQQAAAGATSPFDDARRLHAFAGEGAVERLFVVAAALDSMVPGEAQILGQVKQAYSQAHQEGLAQGGLKNAFEAAFSAAKRVRQQTALGAGRTSMLSLTLHAIDARLKACGPNTSQVVIVGAGDMAEQCGRALRGRGARLLFVNRTLARAQDLAQRFEAEAATLGQYLETPHGTDVLITATASPEPLFDGPFFARLQSAQIQANLPMPLVIDLAVPRDVDTEAALRAQATLYDVDRMRGMAQEHARVRQEAMAAARELLDEALNQYRLKQTERAMGQAIARVRAHGRQTLAQELLALRDALDPAVLQHSWPHIERFAHGLFGQLAHASTRGLKALAHHHGPEALDAYVRGAGLHGPDSGQHSTKDPS